MKVLILYSTKKGTTKKAAHMLAEHFDDVDVRNISRGRVRPDGYDAVVAGSYIRNGKIDPAVKSWLVRYEKDLYDKKLGVFICNALLERVPGILRKNFPEAFIEECVCIDSFGGEYDMDKLNFMEKWSLNSVLNQKKGRRDIITCLLPDRIQVFADMMKEA